MHFPRWCTISVMCLFYLIIVDRIKLSKEFQLNLDEVPQATGYKTKVPDIEHRLMEGWYKMTNGFMSAVNRKVSETTVHLLKYANSGDASVSTIVKEVLKMQYPLVICVAVGVLFIVVMWITGLTFAICRCCCGKCGGEKVQVETSNTPMWRKVLIVLLIIVISLLLVSVICLFITSNSYKESESTLEKTVDPIFDDVVVYLTNVKDQINFFGITSLDKTLDQINTDLDNVEQFVNKEYMEKLTSSGVFQLINAAENISGGFLRVKGSIPLILEHSKALNVGMGKYKVAFKDIADKLDEFKTTCETKCNDIDSSKFDIKDYEEIDMNSIENIEKSINNVDNEKYSQEIKNANESILSIPSEIDRKTKDSQKDIKDKLSTFRTNVHTQVQNVTSDVSQIINEVKKNRNGFNQMLKSWTKHNVIWYVGLAVGIIVAIITGSLLFGLLLGVCGHRSHKQATKRTSTSNAGGYFLMNAVYWMFFFSGFLMLLTILLFLLGNLAEAYVCRILNEENLVTADKIVNELRNTTLHGMLKNIVPSEALRDCKNNQTTFTAFKIDKYINFDSASDYTKNINLDEYREKLSTIKLSEIKLLTPGVKTSLDGFSNALDFTELQKNMDILSRNITLDSDDQKTILEELTKSADSTINGTASMLLATIKATEAELTSFNQQRVKFLNQLQSLNGNSKTIKDGIQMLSGAMVSVEGVLREAVPVTVKEITSKFIDRLKGYGDKMKEFLKEGIKTKFAPCWPLVVIFQSVQVVVCKSSIQTLNGFWFALGWSLFFFVPAIVIAVKLSKHFFRMKYTDKQKNQKSDYDIQLTEKSPYRM